MLTRRVIGASALVTAVLAQQQLQQQGADSLTLLESAIQIGSSLDGTDALGANDDQAPSNTAVNNFINVCAGKTLTDGLQILTGSCNGIPHGDIPSRDNMVSSLIINPQNNDVIQSGQDFQIQVLVSNFEAGAFTNALATYYAAPQFLNGQGNIIGHTHVTVQDLGASTQPGQTLDPRQFAFFRGIDDPPNEQGVLTADVEEGLPPGNYRLCTLVSGANHQPVVMPVAQRGAQDDCIRFTVVGDDFDQNARATDGENGVQNLEDIQDAVELGPGAIDPNADEADAEDAAADDAADDADANDDQGAQEEPDLNELAQQFGQGGAQAQAGQDQNNEQGQGQQGQGQQGQGQQGQGQQGQGQQGQGQQGQGQQGQGQQGQGQQGPGQQGQGQQGQGQQGQGQQGQGQQGQGQQGQGQQGQGQQGQGQQGQGQQGQGQQGQGQQGQGQQGQGQQGQGQQGQGQQGQGQQGQGQQGQGQQGQGQQGQGQQGQGQQGQGQQGQGQQGQGQNNSQGQSQRNNNKRRAPIFARRSFVL